MKLRVLSTLLFALVACRSSSQPTATSSALDTEASPIASHRDLVLGQGPSMAARTTGVPHSNNIDMVVLSDDGAMAMTRDSMGGVRFWPALDGKAEPALVPIRGARAFSLAAGKEGITLAVIDGIGSLHILSAQSDGSMKELYMSSPHTPIRQAQVLGGGQRIVVLAQDHTLSLLDQSGKSLRSLQERRFRPSDFRMANNDSEVVTLTSDRSPLGLSVTLRSVILDRSGDTMTLSDEEIEIDGVMALDDKRFSMNPNGTKLAFLGIPAPASEAKAAPSEEKPAESRPSSQAPVMPTGPIGSVAPAGAPTLIVWDRATETSEPVELGLLAHEIMQVGLGFISNDTLILNSRPAGGSWRVKLGKEITSSALSSAVAQDTQRSAHDFAHGRHLAADGTWLFVQDSHPDSTYYLGYGTFDAQHASISPDGSHVAWTTTQMIYVENVEDAQDSVRISPPATEAFARSAFIDSNHLIAIDYSGGLHLIDWQKGEELASLDTGGGSREFEIDQSRKLVRGVLQNSGSWLVEYDEGVLKGPYVVQDRGYRGGFLDGGNALWSIDGNSRYHAYTLDELRAGLSAGQLNEQLPPMTGSPLAIDAAGRRLYVEPRGLAAIMKIRDEQEQELQSLELPWTPLQTSVSPDGKKLALVSSDGAVLEVFNSKTGNSMWSMSVAQGIRYIAWSQDSQRIALASQVGAVVAKATSGEQLRVTCAPRFERRSTPPISSVSFMQAQNLCER